MKIYTKGGDEGETGLFGGARVPKDAPRIDAYGTVDELNAQLGVARSLNSHSELEGELGRLQQELFVLGADLATPLSGGPSKIRRIGPTDVERLERVVDTYDAQLPALRSFILPGGSPVASQLHVARTVCRRAERCVVRLGRSEQIGTTAAVYLNRLSDLLFVLARSANKHDGAGETTWSG